MGSLSAPSTYAEWSDLLNRLKEKEDDDTILRAMRSGTLAWQAGVAERFSKKLIEVVNFRMNMASDRFQKSMSHSRGQEREIVQALTSLRRELAFLLQVVDLPAIPAKDRQQYADLVTQQASKIQKSLEESAKRDRSGKLSVIVKNNRVDKLTR